MCARLEGRSVIEIKGVDATKLLQGLVTSDVSRLQASSDCQPTVFLNTKGRVLADGLLTKADDNSYLLDCPLPVLQQLIRHIKVYKLRSKAAVTDCSNSLAVVVGGASLPDAPAAADFTTVLGNLRGLQGAVISSMDPRCSTLGARAIVSREVSWEGLGCCTRITESEYDTVRLSHGVAEGRELLERTPLECDLDLLGYISFTKGCYLGQELTARTHFKGVVRKRVLPVIITDQHYSLPRLPSAAELPPQSIRLSGATPAAVAEGVDIVCGADKLRSATAKQ
ncbi:hypothetical protein JKP88DRAFT_283710 [Tribonema minus]|uniref:GCVT N-terminal domain-containing protein n=1 Tax=Tribonema minus TaxID=303371 RepID=A0A835YHD8_9STRA|nr:hypothetical protein JKP88DRAFT_283710 [Tribonema minus]